MIQTLFLVPVHWILILWSIGSLIAIVVMLRRNGFSRDTLSFLAFASICGAVIYFFLPNLQTSMINPADPAGPPMTGLPIRGYGLFLLLATVTGVGLAAWRAKRLGYNPDHIFALAFWMFVLGISGARVFFVIQYAGEMGVNNFKSFVVAMTHMTEGGLVVYGGLIGALIAFATFTLIKKLPMFDFADIIAPSMIIGLSIGRLGCLMNGCCFGGACPIEEIAVQFPTGSPPYIRQIQTGEILGVINSRRPTEAEGSGSLMYVAEEIKPGSPADGIGLKPGDLYFVDFDTRELEKARYGIESASVVMVTPTGTHSIDANVLPARSLKIHPTQIYSSINAALIFLFLWFYFPFRQRSGQVMAVLLMIYPISRTILEFIRIDEPGLWGTPFTISQWVSLFVFGLGVGLYVWVMLRKEEGSPPKEAMPSAA